MSLFRSIATVGGFTFLSRILGFFRDILLASTLGASVFADAFFVAFRFPNLFRSLFAEGSLNVSFIPIFSKKLKQDGMKRASFFTSEVFSFLLYVLVIFTLIVEIFMPIAVWMLAPGFSEIQGKMEITTVLSRITFPFLIFVSLFSLLGGVLNSVGKFAVVAVAPCILNICMIGAMLLFAGAEQTVSYALSYSVVLAGVLQLIWVIYHLHVQNLKFKVLSPIRVLKNFSSDLKLLLKRMIPGIFGSGVYQINLFLSTLFVSFVGAGAISWLSYAHHLFQLPIGIIGVAISTALLPILSQAIHKNDEKEANYQLNRGLEFSLMMSLSSMVGLLILAVPIITVIFQRGAFTIEQTLPTARALQAFAIGLPAYMLTKSLSPLFYANGDTKTPVVIAAWGVLVNAVSCLFLMFPYGHVGIALATGISVWFNAMQYIYIIKKRTTFKIDELFKKRFQHILLSTFLMAIFLYIFDRYTQTLWGKWYENVWMGILILGFLIVISIFIFFGNLYFCGDLKQFKIKNLTIRKK